MPTLEATAAGPWVWGRKGTGDSAPGMPAAASSAAALLLRCRAREAPCPLLPLVVLLADCSHFVMKSWDM